jgi:fermentation-respiration switch protein FrsA (DUF1100 family)
MKRSITILIILFCGCCSYAQGITGNWYGGLKISGQYLHIVFHIAKINDTTYKTTWDSPDQGGRGLASNQTLFTNNKLIIDISNYGINYTGTFLPDSNKITGILKQGNMVMPLTLSPVSNANYKPVDERPQDPKDFPYKQEEVVFTNPKAGDKLAGTLTMPADGKVTKIVVLITGSGPQNRNEEIFNHRPFLVWSDWLTRNGIAVLRYDDRGVAKSTGNFATATTADFADDAEAAVNYIRSRADLKNLSIGLMGHSEGGIIAPLVASRNKAVKFVVMLAGPGVPMVQISAQQIIDFNRLAGSSDETIKNSTEASKKIYLLILQNPNLSATQLKQQIDTLLSQQLRDRHLNLATLIAIKQQKNEMTTPWFRYFLTIDPADYLPKVKCPVLALNGTLDMQVNCPSNLAAVKANLEKGGNKNFEIVPLTGLNHLFQKAVTGNITEYQESPETVSPAALQKVSDWINHL